VIKWNFRNGIPVVLVRSVPFCQSVCIRVHRGDPADGKSIQREHRKKFWRFSGDSFIKTSSMNFFTPLLGAADAPAATTTHILTGLD